MFFVIFLTCKPFLFIPKMLVHSEQMVLVDNKGSDYFISAGEFSEPVHEHIFKNRSAVTLVTDASCCCGARHQVKSL